MSQVATIGPPIGSKTSLAEWEAGAKKRFETLVREQLKDRRYEHGVWTAAYSLLGNLRAPAVSEMAEVLHQVQGHESGWVPWWVPTREPIRPYITGGVLECWMKDSIFDDAAHSDFWRASPMAQMYLVRGYQEDSDDTFTGGQALSLTSPARRVGEILLHASRLAEALGDRRATMNLLLRWEGLAGRKLSPWPTYRRALVDARPCAVHSVTSEITAEADTVAPGLSRLVQLATVPLYQAFGFIPPFSMFEEELGEMVKNRF